MSTEHYNFFNLSLTKVSDKVSSVFFAMDVTDTYFAFKILVYVVYMYMCAYDV